MVEREMDERENLIERERLIEAIKKIAVDKTIRGKHKALLVLYEKISAIEEYNAFVKDYIEFVETQQKMAKRGNIS